MIRPFKLLLACLLLISFGSSASAEEQDKIAGIGPVKEIVKLAGDFKFTEGPAWDGKEFFYFSDIPASKIFRIDVNGKLELFLDETQGVNGLMFSKAGTIYACQTGTGSVLEIDPATKKIKVLVARGGEFEYKQPNDIVIDQSGGFYFTDVEPGCVYYRAADGKVTRFKDGIRRPNGVILSPDEKTLYVIPSGQENIMAYPVEGPGKLGPLKKFCTLTQPPKQSNTGGDGSAVDEKGNLYVASRAGVQVFSPEGKQLGIITSKLFAYPNHPANLKFGGPDNKMLLIAARSGVFKAEMEIAGHQFAGAAKK